ncbi:MAG: ribonuclease HII [Candidatus Paceibacterota bacterium]|jgi:ribonuclease HII
MAVSINFERRLWNKGFEGVVGLDEAGRGPLAGPVVACAVRLSPEFNWPMSKPIFNLMKDSKKLSARQREEFYKILTRYSGIEWGTGRASEKVIDRINILGAAKLAMERAVDNLKSKSRNSKIDFLVLDGNFKIASDVLQQSVVGADGKVFSCMAAGIIAKVSRDRIMLKLHQKYPCYGFDRHKGYGTLHHYRMIKKHGFCDIHRRSFNLTNKGWCV